MIGKKGLAATLAGLLIAAMAVAAPQKGTPPLTAPTTPATAAAPAPTSPPANPELTASDVGAWLDGYFPGDDQGRARSLARRW
jgi:hypothetical protein